jgi:hypothetical protein
LTSVLEGLDFGTNRFLTWETGLVAVERFTGAGPTADDLGRIESSGVAFRILPWLPELYAQARLPDGTRRWPGHGPLGADTDRLALLADEDLVVLAWWAAGYAAAHAGFDQMPCVAESLAAQALTAEAQFRVRRSQLAGYSMQLRVWAALHAATNPDPLGAAIGALEEAQLALGTDAHRLVTSAVDWLNQRLV